MTAKPEHKNSEEGKRTSHPAVPQDTTPESTQMPLYSLVYVSDRVGLCLGKGKEVDRNGMCPYSVPYRSIQWRE